MKKKALDLKLIKHVALLADLKLGKKEVKKLQKQLSEILDYFNVLNKLNTKGVEPTSQVTGLENVFREDKPRPSLSQEEVLSGGKEKHNDFFKVKAIFEEK